jgi:peroxiredoxin
MKNTILSFAALIAIVVGALAFMPVNDGGLKIGDIAPDFKLKNVDGKMISLADHKGAEGYIVIFSCNHCPWVIKYEDRMIDLHNKFASQGFPVIAINPNDPEVQPEDSFEKMQQRAREKNFPFAYVIDEGQKVFPQYGATRTPHVFLLDKNRKVRYIGAIDDSPEDGAKATELYIENAIASIKKGMDPDPNFTKAIGCTIKVKKDKS